MNSSYGGPAVFVPCVNAGFGCEHAYDVHVDAVYGRMLRLDADGGPAGSGECPWCWRRRLAGDPHP